MLIHLLTFLSKLEIFQFPNGFSLSESECEERVAPCVFQFPNGFSPA